MKWVDNHIEIEPPKRPKKITGTRFAAILGLNPWATPFEVWCEITRTWQKPFEDTVYTLAGKAIEPKQIAYMRNAYAMGNLRTPTDIFGPDYFNKTYGDFFHDASIFGGMWDSLLVDEQGKPEAVLEFKTTKRSEDWASDVPEYYALQAALYAYLLDVDDVIMAASFLEAGDYDRPEAFVPSAANTITVEFKVSERYPGFAGLVYQAGEWWEEYVQSGLSPDFDEKRDAEILKILRTNSLSPATDMDELIADAEALRAEVDAARAAIADKEKALAQAEKLIKEYAVGQFRPGDKKVAVKGRTYTWAVSRTETAAIDKDALKADGLLDKYTKTATQYRMTVK